jgi:electron transfer flavoprotein beta subunit
MDIIVLVKQVPDTGQLSILMDALRLSADGGPRIVNPWDEYAIEAGLRLKEAHGGKVVLLSLGNPEAVEALKTGLAMGADEAILVSDPALEGGDSLATARALAAAITKVGSFDLIIAGRAAIDGNNAAVAVQVAALLKLPQISYVAALHGIDPAARTLTAVRLVENGRETVSSRLPAVITVVQEINEPRYPSYIGTRRAAKTTIPTWDLAELNLPADCVGAAGAQVRWKTSLPATRKGGAEVIAGSPPQTAKILLDKLIATKVI